MRTIILAATCLSLLMAAAGCSKNPLSLTRLSQKDLDEKCIWIDWKEEEESIIKAFGRRLASGDVLKPEWKGNDLWANYNGQAYQLPLTNSRKDRSVAISSLSEILKDKYEARLLKWSKETDSRAFLLLPKADWTILAQGNPQWVQTNFESVPVGIDLFGNGEQVPYVHR